MAYDREQIKLTMSGYLGDIVTGGEEFAWGIHISGDAAFDSVAKLATIDMPAINALVVAFHQSPSLSLANDASFVTLKAAALDPAGHYLTDALEYQGSGTLGYAGVGTLRPANQIALCVSLGTTTTIGRAVRGRFYLPLPAAALTDDGRWGGTFNIGAANAARDFLDGLNDELNVGPEPAVVQLMSSVGTTGLRSRAVTTVRVGDVPDTIQSRRRQLDESYAAASVSS